MRGKHLEWPVERFVRRECEQKEGLQLHFEGMTVRRREAVRRAVCFCVLPDTNSWPYSGAVSRSAPVTKNQASLTLFCCRQEGNTGRMVLVCSLRSPPPQMRKAGRNCLAKLLELVDLLPQIYSQIRCSNLVLWENRNWQERHNLPRVYLQDQGCCLDSCSSTLQEVDLWARQPCVRIGRAHV